MATKQSNSRQGSSKRGGSESEARASASRKSSTRGGEAAAKPAARGAAAGASARKAAAGASKKGATGARKAASGGAKKAAAGTGRGTAGARAAGARGGAASGKRGAAGATAARGAAGRGASAKASSSKSARGAAGAAATSRKAGASKAGSRKKGGDARALDAAAFLKQEHEALDKLFSKFERMTKRQGADEGAKMELAQRICTDLASHAQIEEEIFYPALREALDDVRIVEEAAIEHDSAKVLMAQIQGSLASEPRFDALVMVLAEYVRHHVEEEENEIFKKAKRAKLDMKAMGERLAQRKAQLQADPDSAPGTLDMGSTDDADELADLGDELSAQS